MEVVCCWVVDADAMGVLVVAAMPFCNDCGGYVVEDVLRGD